MEFNKWKWNTVRSEKEFCFYNHKRIMRDKRASCDDVNEYSISKQWVSLRVPKNFMDVWGERTESKALIVLLWDLTDK